MFAKVFFSLSPPLPLIKAQPSTELPHKRLLQKFFSSNSPHLPDPNFHGYPASVQPFSQRSPRIFARRDLSDNVVQLLMRDKRRHRNIIDVRPLPSSRVSDYAVGLRHGISQQLLVGVNGCVEMLKLLKLLREYSMSRAERVVLGYKLRYGGVVGVKNLACLAHYCLGQCVKECILFGIRRDRWYR